jgi:hypothetical protein
MAKPVAKSLPRNSLPQRSAGSAYSAFEEIDGSHPLKERVRDFCVEYQARERTGGTVAYFNFDLAREMGLIAADHPNEMNKRLEKKILETFGLMIINEWDIENKVRFPKRTIKKNTYMATRYLQLQHDDKSGRNSGDGRSIWNGCFSRNGVTWDVSSCGTGATCLSPATSKHGKFFRSGDPSISYGCGLADFPDAMAAVMMSEVFSQRRVPTERSLAIIRYRNNTSINVRAGKNLLRPAHIFRYLKQSRLPELKSLVDFFIEREVSNNLFKKSQRPYQNFLEKMTEAFARSSALFEREYIFCWFDWDGDNILAQDAAILDYGSIRQFGLFHKEYRYDDIERFSTNILEQKQKARYIVQTFAQITDYLENGKKRPISDFDRDPALKQFDEHFDKYKKLFLLRKIGMSDRCQSFLMECSDKLVSEFQKEFEYFERLQSQIGVYKVEDGITSNAIFSMRDFLREYPKVLLSHFQAVETHELINMIQSSYATEEDLNLTEEIHQHATALQNRYLEIIKTLATYSRQTINRTLLEITMRSALLNRFDQITGNGILRATESILKNEPGNKKIQLLVDEFIHFQSEPKTVLSNHDSTQDKRHLLRLVGIIKSSREEI